MQVEKRIISQESTITGEAIGMSIDEGALAHIMSVLTDLYSDPELAVVREYSTNALDAHIDAGVTRPIEVTLPTPLAPFYTVRDFGAGLSAADIRDIFSRYGTSTKRESNDVVGMLGLGCKSALTYADQFTLTSTKEGRTIQVLISRDEDGAGSMTIVADTPAGAQGNGTTITVPAKRDNAFRSKAEDFYRFWETGTVLVNGEQPAPIDGLWLTDTLLLTRECDFDYIVMGNVPYPVPSDTPSWQRSGAHHTVAFVDIGEVSFTPSRESLQMTRGTKATIERIAADAERERDRSCREQIEGASSPVEAVRLLAECRSIGFTEEATYRGRVVPAKLYRRPTSPDGTPRHYDARNAENADSFLTAGSQHAKVKGERTFAIDIAADWHLFEGFDSRELTPTKRDKLRHWFESKGLDSKPQVYVERFTADERFWLQGRTIHKWSDVDAIVLPRDPAILAGGGVPRGAYDVVKGGNYATIQAAEIDTTRPLYWIHGNSQTARNHDAIRYSVIPMVGCTIVALPGGRIEKFRRDFPTAVRLDDAARKQAEVWLKRVSADDAAAYQFLTVNGNLRMRLAGLDPKRVDDPELRRAIALSNRDISKVKEEASRYMRFGASIQGGDVSGALAPYPLLSSDYGRGYVNDSEHVYLYCNAAYAARTGKVV